MQEVKIGTRGSNLAIWQAEYLATSLKMKIPGIKVSLKIIKTKGDKILDVALSKIGDKGLFTKEIENELIAGNIDMAVHSMKDLPAVLDAQLCLGAVMKREDPRDVLISHKGYNFNNLPENAVLGTSSLRRIAQVKAIRSDIECVEIRGNVETRLRKMEEQNLDGIILAYAGVKRLGFEKYIKEIIPEEIILPAVGQGAIAIEIRKNDLRLKEIAASITDMNTYYETVSERAFLAELEGGCQVPIASLAKVEHDKIVLEGLISSLDGKLLVKATQEAEINEGEHLGISLARQLLNSGGKNILESIKV